VIGKTISHYRVLRVLGEGGMGVVYEAEDTRLGRHVALKFIVHGALDRGESIERFLREARAASALNHPNICTLHDVGEVDGDPFIAMELLEGATLDVLMAEGPLRPLRVVEIGIQIAEGLDAAHTRGVIHRDVKPANIFVTSAGLIKIMDFGLAKLQASTAEVLAGDLSRAATAHLTLPGSPVGTVSYMSPEQARGENVDARADLFSFGTLLYTMAVGEPPFRGRTIAVILSAILERQPTPPRDRNPDLPPKLQEIILKALEKKLEDRYSSARHMLDDLRRLRRELASGEDPFISGPTLTGFSPVPAAGSAAGPRVASEPGRSVWRGRYGLALAAVAAAALAGGLAWWRSATAPERAPAAAVPSEIRSLVVLPLENLSHDPSQDYFADGMTDELITKLSNISALRVISRTSALHYKGSKKSLPQIARELQVEAAVEGSVLRSNDRVRINARLSRVPGEEQIWAEGYERDLRDVLALQSDVASAIARAIRVKIAPRENARLASKGPVDPEAYQLYLQGRTAFSRFTPDSLSKSADYFNLAIAKDPSYALAYAGLADSNIQLAGRLLPPHEVMPKARTAIQRALELDENLGEAHSSLAQVKIFYEYDWDGARAEFGRALEMSPGSALIHQMNGLFLSSQGKSEEALAEAKRALDVDPVSSNSGCMRARILYYARRYDEAIAQYRKTLEADPTATGSCTWAIFAFHETSRLDEAIAAAKHSVDVSPNEMLPRAALARAYGIAGDRVQAEKTLAKLRELSTRRFVSEYEFAVANSGWNLEETLAWLEKAYGGRVGMLVYLKVDSVFDELRSDARFQELVRRVGIP
jgi:serine/threonine protein kinase/tetratricopeptide (TPR) repeat protein